MSLPISARYAVRSLLRHSRRTFLSVVGIGVGCALSLFLIAWVRGESLMFVKAAAESGAGHVRIVPTEWKETRENDLRMLGWEECLKKVRSAPMVKVATPRARKDGLLAFGSRVVGIELLGVDPDTERAANRLVKNIVEGRYLQKGDRGSAVVGRSVARRLDVELDDDLMVTVAGTDGEIGSAMLRIVGIAETGSRDLDGTICHVLLEDVETFTGLGGAGEITILLKDSRKLEAQVELLSSVIPEDSSAITWKVMAPELASAVKMDETWNKLTVGVVMIVVFLGIASAQLAAVLERRREFAVLAALGMKNARMVYVMLVEGFILGLLGTVCGLGIGIPVTYYVATRGIDFTEFYGDTDVTMSNVMFDPVFRGDFGWWLIPLALGLCFGATMLSSFYPAWYATKTDPAAALRVEH